MRHLSIILLIVFLAILPSCKNKREKGLFGKKTKTLAELKAQQKSLRIADSLKRVESRLQAIEEARQDSIRMAEEERVPVATSYKYNIIVGSFNIPENARAVAEEYRRRGYVPDIIRETGSQLELVVAESHESYSTAVARLRQFQDTVDADIWLYIQK